MLAPVSDRHAYQFSTVDRRFQQPGFLLLQRKPNAESCAPSNLALQIDPAPVCANDALHDHQTQARTLFLGGVKRFKNSIELLLRNSATGIGDTNPNTIWPLAGLHAESSPFGHCLHRILDQID